jgi:hypothetical protein
MSTLVDISHRERNGERIACYPRPLPFGVDVVTPKEPVALARGAGVALTRRTRR